MTMAMNMAEVQSQPMQDATLSFFDSRGSNPVPRQLKASRYDWSRTQAGVGIDVARDSALQSQK